MECPKCFKCGRPMSGIDGSDGLLWYWCFICGPRLPLPPPPEDAMNPIHIAMLEQVGERARAELREHSEKK